MGLRRLVRAGLVSYSVKGYLATKVAKELFRRPCFERVGLFGQVKAMENLLKSEPLFWTPLPSNYENVTRAQYEDAVDTHIKGSNF